MSTGPTGNVKPESEVHPQLVRLAGSKPASSSKTATQKQYQQMQARQANMPSTSVTTPAIAASTPEQKQYQQMRSKLAAVKQVQAEQKQAQLAAANAPANYTSAIVALTSADIDTASGKGLASLTSAQLTALQSQITIVFGAAVFGALQTLANAGGVASLSQSQLANSAISSAVSMLYGSAYLNALQTLMPLGNVNDLTLAQLQTYASVINVVYPAGALTALTANAQNKEAYNTAVKSLSAASINATNGSGLTNLNSAQLATLASAIAMVFGTPILTALQTLSGYGGVNSLTTTQLSQANVQSAVNTLYPAGTLVTIQSNAATNAQNQAQFDNANVSIVQSMGGSVATYNSQPDNNAKAIYIEQLSAKHFADLIGYNASQIASINQNISSASSDTARQQIVNNLASLSYIISAIKSQIAQGIADASDITGAIKLWNSYSNANMTADQLAAAALVKPNPLGNNPYPEGTKEWYVWMVQTTQTAFMDDYIATMGGNWQAYNTMPTAQQQAYLATLTLSPSYAAANYVQLNNGDVVYTTAFSNLSPSDQKLLQQVGVSQFNAAKGINAIGAVTLLSPTGAGSAQPVTPTTLSLTTADTSYGAALKAVTPYKNSDGSYNLNNIKASDVTPELKSAITLLFPNYNTDQLGKIVVYAPTQTYTPPTTMDVSTPGLNIKLVPGSTPPVEYWAQDTSWNQKYDPSIYYVKTPISLDAYDNAVLKIVKQGLTQIQIDKTFAKNYIQAPAAVYINLAPEFIAAHDVQPTFTWVQKLMPNPYQNPAEASVWDKFLGTMNVASQALGYEAMALPFLTAIPIPAFIAMPTITSAEAAAAMGRIGLASSIGMEMSIVGSSAINWNKMSPTSKGVNIVIGALVAIPILGAARQALLGTVTQDAKMANSIQLALADGKAADKSIEVILRTSISPEVADSYAVLSKAAANYYSNIAEVDKYATAIGDLAKTNKSVLQEIISRKPLSPTAQSVLDKVAIELSSGISPDRLTILETLKGSIRLYLDASAKSDVLAQSLTDANAAYQKAALQSGKIGGESGDLSEVFDKDIVKTLDTVYSATKQAIIGDSAKIAALDIQIFKAANAMIDSEVLSDANQIKIISKQLSALREEKTNLINKNRLPSQYSAIQELRQHASVAFGPRQVRLINEANDLQRQFSDTLQSTTGVEYWGKYGGEGRSEYIRINTSQLSKDDMSQIAKNWQTENQLAKNLLDQVNSKLTELYSDLKIANDTDKPNIQSKIDSLMDSRNQMLLRISDYDNTKLAETINSLFEQAKVGGREDLGQFKAFIGNLVGKLKVDEPQIAPVFVSYGEQVDKSTKAVANYQGDEIAKLATFQEMNSKLNEIDGVKVNIATEGDKLRPSRFTIKISEVVRARAESALEDSGFERTANGNYYKVLSDGSRAEVFFDRSDTPNLYMELLTKDLAQFNGLVKALSEMSPIIDLATISWTDALPQAVESALVESATPISVIEFNKKYGIGQTVKPSSVTYTGPMLGGVVRYTSDIPDYVKPEFENDYLRLYERMQGKLQDYIESMGFSPQRVTTMLKDANSELSQYAQQLNENLQNEIEEMQKGGMVKSPLPKEIEATFEKKPMSLEEINKKYGIKEYQPTATEVGKTEAPAGIPFMITNQMRNGLKLLGYADFEIDGLTPKEAWDLLKDNEVEDIGKRGSGRVSENWKDATDKAEKQLTEISQQRTKVATEEMSMTREEYEAEQALKQSEKDAALQKAIDEAKTKREGEEVIKEAREKGKEDELRESIIERINRSVKPDIIPDLALLSTAQLMAQWLRINKAQAVYGTSLKTVMESQPIGETVTGVSLMAKPSAETIPSIKTQTLIKQQTAISPQELTREQVVPGPQVVPETKTQAQDKSYTSTPNDNVRTVAGLPILIGSNGKPLTEEQLLGSMAWKQGIMYKMWYPPYGQDDILNSRTPFAGVTNYKGFKAAYKSLIRRTPGTIPPLISRSMGMFTTAIVGGDKANSQPQLVYKEHEERKGRGPVRASLVGM